jgi:hypothetical protein
MWQTVLIRPVHAAVSRAVLHSQYSVETASNNDVLIVQDGTAHSSMHRAHQKIVCHMQGAAEQQLCISRPPSPAAHAHSSTCVRFLQVT